MSNNNDLVLSNLNLAYKISWDYFKKLNGFIEYDDILSIAYIGLIKASGNFDKEKNFSFSTYAYTVMKNEILGEFNKLKNNVSTISLYEEIGDNLHLEDMLYSDINVEDITEKNILIYKLYEFINELTDIEKLILESKLKNLSNTKIQDITGLSKTTINKIYKKLINKLRMKFYRDMGDDDI